MPLQWPLPALVLGRLKVDWPLPWCSVPLRWVLWWVRQSMR
jgi:hypothetical protein